MNERIKIVGDTEVWIGTGYCPNAPMRLYLHGSELRSEQQAPYKEIWDDEGRDALIDALQCHKATGSFAALADTSNVPYVGKVVMTSHGRGVVMQVGDGDKPALVQVRQGSGSNLWFTRQTILPLTPPPKYRAYTPVEAAAHLNRDVRTHDGSVIALSAVLAVCIKLDGRHYSFDSFVKNCCWADTGEPCGVRE